MKATVAIIGGGFTGASVACHLARMGASSHILVFEPRPTLGAGLAYGDSDLTHRINVPAAFMSMLPDDEGHFARWLEASGLLAADPAARVGEHAFPARAAFAHYVAETVGPHVESGVVRQVREPVEAVWPEAGGWRIETRSGRRFRARIAVIATTHPPACVPRELAGLAGHPRLIADALAPNSLAQIGAGERVLIVGAGLTAADVVATLDAQGHEGAIVMIARRGLRSRAHPSVPHPAQGDFVTAPARRASELLRALRRELRVSLAAGRGWHPVLEAVRLQGQAIWAALEPDARRRVARHLRSHWDAHRFRLPPQVEALLEARLGDGSLVLRKARLGAVRAQADGFVVELGGRAERFDRIALATGPAHAEIFASQPYLRGLRDQGLVAVDATGLGLTTARNGRAVGRDGPEPTLFVAGPLARGTFGELMGLPAVAIYARFIADEIAATLR